MGHQVAGPKLAEERNLSIATMWAQGSSDRLELDSRWDVKRGLQGRCGRSAKSKDVKACAEEGLRGAETALARLQMQTRRDAGSGARLRCSGGRSRCGVAESWLTSGCRGWAARRLKAG